jgi:hypothetical protein
MEGIQRTCLESFDDFSGGAVRLRKRPKIFFLASLIVESTYHDFHHPSCTPSARLNGILAWSCHELDNDNEAEITGHMFICMYFMASLEILCSERIQTMFVYWFESHYF